MASRSSSASACTKTTYTNPNGLVFSLYCDRDQTDLEDIDDVGADNIEDCLDRCSIYDGSLCGAVSFDSIEQRCYFKAANSTAAGANRRTGWTLGVANETQIQSLPSVCNGSASTASSQNGLDFTVYCDQWMYGFDLCPNESSGCRSHANSLEECLESCSKLHPLCTGVVWIPSLRGGDSNCFPKNSTARAFDDARKLVEPGAAPAHIAKALLEVLPNDCQSQTNGTMMAINKDVFKLSCQENRAGNNIMTQHADSIDTCINSCATYMATDCIGVSFDADMAGGYENCYLKSSIGDSIPDDKGFAFASRQIVFNDSVIPSQQKEGNKAWIAGLVIGLVAALSVVASILCWWRRRKRSMKAREIQHVEPPKNWQKAELGPTTIRVQSVRPYKAWQQPELDSMPMKTPKYELSASHLVHEMDSPPSELPFRSSRVQFRRENS